MTYYIAVHPSGTSALWLIEPGALVARRGDGATECVDVAPGADALKTLEATRPTWSFHPLDLRPGEYYPRMARPNAQHPSESPGSNPLNDQNSELIEAGRGQLMALRYQMEALFRAVHPVEANFLAFGHEFRNLLILAATEVEAHWKGVMSAHGRRADTTRDYVKLADAMRLSEYAIRLPFFPWLNPVRPFAGWTEQSTSPTRDLPWYDAYQAVKHDRENQFQRATLFNALQALCGCAVMLFAQFGTFGFHYRIELNSFFEIHSAPAWHPSEVYSFGPEATAWTAVTYSF